MGLLEDIGRYFSGAYGDEAERALQEATGQYGDIETPGAGIEDIQYLGDYIPPEIAEKYDISTDPRLREAQYQALEQLQRIGQAEGLTAEDQLRREMLQQQMATQQRGQREAIMQGMRQRGLGGSGAELAAMLQGQQGSAMMGAMGGHQIAADAERRALQAMQQAGQMGGRMRGQEFGEQKSIEDARRALQQFNIANKMRAGMAGWGQRQDIAAENVRRRQAERGTEFGRQMQLRGARAGADLQRAKYYGGRQREGDVALGGAIKAGTKFLWG
jgi:hypothetical protein